MEPFRVAVEQALLDDLQRRLAHTRWAADPGNGDWGYGTNGNFLRKLLGHWQTGYDWREHEARMNRLPQFRTTVDGQTIHFVHARGQGPKPMPLLLNHGWPWTFWDYQKVIGPLADPAAYGGDEADAFDVVVPSLPGYGFSSPLARTGINFWRTAEMWVGLMQQIGHERFGTHGGDWGAFISAQLGHRHAGHVIGVHLHFASPLDFMTGGRFARDDYDDEERDQRRVDAAFAREEMGYNALQSTRPQAASFAVEDSPLGLAAWLVEKRRRWSDCGGDVERRFSKDDLLTSVMLYWVTQTFGSSLRYYAEALRAPWQASHAQMPVVQAPTGVMLFPGEIFHPPRRWLQRYYNLQRLTRVAAGGHFAPMEEPAAVVDDLRAFFRPLRS